jgi:PPOX class probable F420-dependent enzyme
MLSRMDTATELAAARLARFLEEEPVVWLSSVGPDGAPHLVPTWFAWDGEALTILSKPGARKVRNLEMEPRAMLALGDAEDDFDVGMFEATAEVLPEPTPLALPAGFAAKYAERIASMGLTEAQFARTYSRVIRLRPRRALGWHGRSTPRSIMDAAAAIARVRQVSMSEPWRATLRGLLGEPMGRPSAI